MKQNKNKPRGTRHKSYQTMYGKEIINFDVGEIDKAANEFLALIKNDFSESISTVILQLENLILMCDTMLENLYNGKYDHGVTKTQKAALIEAVKKVHSKFEHNLQKIKEMEDD